MKRFILFLAAVGVLTSGVVAASSGADGAAAPATLHLVGKQITENGPNGRPHPGSMVVFSGRETGEDRGRSYVQCTLIDRVHGLCLGQFNLARGTISVETAIPLEDSPATLVLDITGGTGAYDGARGTATFKDIGKDKTDETFAFKP
jgi:hypothetical protein